MLTYMTPKEDKKDAEIGQLFINIQLDGNVFLLFTSVNFDLIPIFFNSSTSSPV